MIGGLGISEMERLLRSQVTGRIGCHAEGKTYVVPVTFAYQPGFIYGRTGVGEKVRLMRLNPSVCFEVDRMDDLSHWESVILQGTYVELHGEEAAKAMSHFSERLDAGCRTVGRALQGLFPELERAVQDGRDGVVFEIRIKEMTGRFERHFHNGISNPAVSPTLSDEN